MKIPKEYSGLGLSQVNYNRTVAMISSHCGNTAVWLSAHQSIALPNIALNLAVTEALDYIATELESEVKRGRKLDAAVKVLLRKLVKGNKRIIFNGNGYSDEWRKDAARRGLLNLRNTVEALPEFLKPEVISTFEKYRVLNERELRARHEVKLETYIKTINMEAQMMVLMANRYILPAALEYLAQVAGSVTAVKNAGAKTREGQKVLDELTKLIDTFRVRTTRLVATLDHADTTPARHARHMSDAVVPAMDALREAGDLLETVLPHGLWPLPTYREMLFIK